MHVDRPAPAVRVAVARQGVLRTRFSDVCVPRGTTETSVDSLTKLVALLTRWVAFLHVLNAKSLSTHAGTRRARPRFGGWTDTVACVLVTLRPPAHHVR